MRQPRAFVQWARARAFAHVAGARSHTQTLGFKPESLATVEAGAEARALHDSRPVSTYPNNAVVAVVGQQAMAVVSAACLELAGPEPRMFGSRPDPVRVEVPSTLTMNELLGALIALQPTVKVTIEAQHCRVGLCLAEGRIIAAAAEGDRLCDDPALIADPDLGPQLALLAGVSRSLDARAAMQADMSFTCERDDLLGRTGAFTRHVGKVVGRLIEDTPTVLTFEEHGPSSHGVPLGTAWFEAFRALPEAERRGWLGEGPFQGSGHIPQWLRGTLSPTRFGRLFFDLSEPVRLDVLPRGRLEQEELEAALALGIATGAIRTARRPIARAPERAAADTSAPTTATPPQAPRAPGAITRRQSRTQRQFAAHTQIALEQTRCGSAAHAFALLGAFAVDAQRQRRHVRLSGTRFEPAGLTVGAFLGYYALAESTFAQCYVGAMAEGPLGGKLLMLRGVRRPTGTPHNLERRVTSARILAAHEHPNLLRGLGEIRVDDSQYELLEMVHGVTLAELVGALQVRQQALPERLKQHLRAQVGYALAAVQAETSTEDDELSVGVSDVLVGFDGTTRVSGFSHGGESTLLSGPAIDAGAEGERQLAELCREVFGEFIAREREALEMIPVADAADIMRALKGGET